MHVQHCVWIYDVSRVVCCTVFDFFVSQVCDLQCFACVSFSKRKSVCFGCLNACMYLLRVRSYNVLLGVDCW